MKYQIICVKCNYKTNTFSDWFAQNQSCPKCGSKHAEITYSANYIQLNNLLKNKAENIFHYFDFLPVENKKNIISFQEGTIPIESWDFLSNYALENYGIKCKVLVYRNDLNGGTNTFKDVAAALAASLFKENGIKQYCMASTGNTATAYAKYLAEAGVRFTIFVPNCVEKETVDEIKSYQQDIRIVNGDYAFAKKEAADFHAKYKILISAGNIDPIRVEAKRTMVFEFLRQLGKMPDVYIQAVSGGTGPIAINKGIREIAPYFPDIKLPRMLLVQQDTCDPMVQAWEKAVKNNFPQDFEKDYPIIDNPQTKISILSTGNPAMYPIVAPIVKKSNGSFIRIRENELIQYARLVKDEKNLLLGPASIVCISGFYEALKQGKINKGDIILINTGEGGNRAKNFIKTL